MSQSPCDKCKKEVVSGVKAMSHDLRSNWSHISCIKGMTELMYDALLNGNKCNGLKWFCPNYLDCIVAVKKTGNAKVKTTCINTTRTQTSSVCISTAVTPNQHDSRLETNDAEEAGSSHLGSPGNDAGTGRSSIYAIQNNQNRKDTFRTLLICRYYRIGKCNKGENYIFRHPAKCIKYCRSEREGCGGGFHECQLLHPELCWNFLESRECNGKDCTRAHQKETIRKSVKEKFHNGYHRLDQRSIHYQKFQEMTPQRNVYHSQNPPLPAHTAVAINLEYKWSHYYQNQDKVHGWHKQSAFPSLNTDPVPEETTYNPAQNCVAAPISQQMLNPCADNPIF